MKKGFIALLIVLLFVFFFCVSCSKETTENSSVIEVVESTQQVSSKAQEKINIEGKWFIDIDKSMDVIVNKWLPRVREHNPEESLSDNEIVQILGYAIVLAIEESPENFFIEFKDGKYLIPGEYPGEYQVAEDGSLIMDARESGSVYENEIEILGDGFSIVFTRDAKPFYTVWPEIDKGRDASAEEVQRLIDSGADVNWGLSGDGSNALIKAFNNGCNEDVLLALINGGADVDFVARNDDYSALMYTLMYGCSDSVLKAIIDKSKGFEFKNKYGDTDLDHILESNRPYELVLEVLNKSKNVDPHTRCNIVGHSVCEEITKEPTCTEKGEKTISCSMCGDSYKTTVEALGHSYVESVTKEPTCTTRGTAKFTCQDCSYITYSVIEPLGHDWKTIDRHEPTCTSEGFADLLCSRCGITKHEILSVLPHDYQCVEKVDAKCACIGYEKYECSFCKDEKTVEYPAKGHVLVNCLCTVCGLDIIGPAGGYIFYDCDADNEVGNQDGLISSECGWRYLEAAPTDLLDENGQRATYKLYDYQLYSYEINTKTGIGTGELNAEIWANSRAKYYFRYYLAGEEREDGLYYFDVWATWNMKGMKDADGNLCPQWLSEEDTTLYRDLAVEDGIYDYENGAICWVSGKDIYNTLKDDGYLTCKDGAIYACNNYTLNGYDDWFLPSKDELNLMYTNLYKNKVGDFSLSKGYLSSSLTDSGRCSTQNFSNGNQYLESYPFGLVRPIRAF